MTECDKETTFTVGEEMPRLFIDDGEDSPHVPAQVDFHVYTYASCLDERHRPSKRAPLPNKANR